MGAEALQHGDFSFFGPSWSSACPLVGAGWDVFVGRSPMRRLRFGVAVYGGSLARRLPYLFLGDTRRPGPLLEGLVAFLPRKYTMYIFIDLF